MCYYQFRRRHDYPPQKKTTTMFGQPRILNKCDFVVDRRSIDVLTKSIRKASDRNMIVGKTNTKIGGFVVDRNIIDLYYKIGGFVVDHKSIGLLSTSIRKASEMRLA